MDRQSLATVNMKPAERNTETRYRHVTCRLEISLRGKGTRDATIVSKVGTGP